MTQDHIKLSFTEIDNIKNELFLVHTFLAGALAGTTETRAKSAANSAMFRLDNIVTVLDTMIEEVLEGETGE